MNWGQFKVPVSHLRLGTEAAFWSPTGEAESLNPFNDKHFSENISGKLKCQTFKCIFYIFYETFDYKIKTKCVKHF